MLFRSAKGIAITKGLFPWTASGRAIANGRDEGFTKLLEAFAFAAPQLASEMKPVHSPAKLANAKVRVRKRDFFICTSPVRLDATQALRLLTISPLSI